MGLGDWRQSDWETDILPIAGQDSSTGEVEGKKGERSP